MTTTKLYNRYLDRCSTRKYCAFELQNMEHNSLIRIASHTDITVGQAADKQSLINAIINQQK